MEKIPVPHRPARLINAIASIGYDPEVALCDLIDNSIDAQASSIRVSIEGGVKEKGQLKEGASYVIADDGVGMNRDTLIGAFTLGTDRDYPHGSLGKFGLGLKSAGLSLGNEIVILTQESGSSPLYARLSIPNIEKSGEYEIDLGDIPENFAEYWENRPGNTHGTVLIIGDLEESLPRGFPEYLERYCAIAFHRFLERDNQPLEMSIDGTILEPFDPLFVEVARGNGTLGNPSSWDGRTIHLLFEGELDLGPAKASIAGTHLVHPPSFGDDQRKAMESRFAIATDPYNRLPRHGFYVYRNERVIALAERFHGLVRNQVQNWAFKARLMFDERADSVLSLDVKKRHLLLPRGVRQNLQELTRDHQRKSIAAWTEAGKTAHRVKSKAKERVANDSIGQGVSSLDYRAGSSPEDDASTHLRKARQEDISQETKDAIQDREAQEKLEERIEGGDVVIPVQGLKGNMMWLPYPAVSIGRAETILNEYHTWISDAYEAAEDEPRIQIILHQIFTILARAELEVRTMKWGDLTTDQIDSVFERFRRKASATGEDLAEDLKRALNEYTRADTDAE